MKTVEEEDSVWVDEQITLWIGSERARATGDEFGVLKR